VYIIEVKAGDKTWKAYRRYKQFQELDTQVRIIDAIRPLNHSQLASKFTRDVLPQLPRKHFWRSSTNPSLIDERKDLLEKYLQGLKKHDVIVRSEILATWLSEANNNVRLPPCA
jgi:hypothetical protein